MHDPTFTAPGRFWRGNFHTHSTRSDGVVAPWDVCARYEAQGYDFIALTDHFLERYDYPIVDTTPFRSDGFTTLLGAELHVNAMENGDPWHILAVGLPADFAPPQGVDGESGPQIAARARAAGAYVAVAHPEWGGLSLADARSIDAAHAVEIYNHGCHIAADRGHGFWHLDRLLEEGRRLTLCATDDAHFYEPDHFGGWTMVKAEENSPDALLAALKAGHSYASTGPELHDVVWSQSEVSVRCSAAQTIIVQGERNLACAHHGQDMTQATVSLAQFEKSAWLRLTVVDPAGRRAWTNPVWR